MKVIHGLEASLRKEEETKQKKVGSPNSKM